MQDSPLEDPLSRVVGGLLIVLAIAFVAVRPGAAVHAVGSGPPSQHGPPPIAAASAAPPSAPADATPSPLPGPQPAPTSAAPPTNPIRGIDVSHFQGQVDWATVFASGVRFAYAKATDGLTFNDPAFTAHVKGARAAGLSVGAYHFFEPGDDPVAQAEHFLSVAQPKSGDLPPVLDLEVAPSANDAPLSQSALTWLQHVQKATGCTPIIYASPAFFDAHLSSGFDGFPLYLADYASTPTLPQSAGELVIWQHSQTGQVPGVKGHVDLDRLMARGKTLSDMVCP